MSAINANIVVETTNLTVTPTTNDITFAVDPITLNVSAGGFVPAGGNLTELQYNDNGVFGGVANTSVANGNITFTNLANLKIVGGTNAYYLQTDGANNLTWAAGGTPTGSGVPSGANTLIQLSDGSGAFDSAPGFSFDKTSNTLQLPAINGIVRTNDLNVSDIANIQTLNYPITGFHVNLGNGSVAGTTGTAYGYNADASDFTSLALGYNADGQGQESISIGLSAAAVGIQGPRNISIGSNIRGNTTGSSFGSAIKIGYAAGSNPRESSTIAIGTQAGARNDSNDQGGQDEYAIAIGHNAGYDRQGAHSIALGYRAGYQTQAENSIVLNATTGSLTTGTPNAFIVKPIRSATTLNVLYYDTTTGEITYDNGSGVPSPAAGANTQVQFNTNGALDANPNFTFDTATNILAVVGNITCSNTIKSTVPYGLPPFEVLSTARVANLNAYYAGTADFATSATTANVVAFGAQTNITSVGTLTNLDVGTGGTGNINVADRVTMGRITCNSEANINSANVQSILQVGAWIKQTPKLLSTLGSAVGQSGVRAMINDIVGSPTWGTTAVGGGGSTYPVWSNGSNWLIG